LTEALSQFVDRFGKWRIAFSVFLVAFAAIILLYLDYAPIQWDETPHLMGPLVLSRGQLFFDYLEGYAFYPPLFDTITVLYYTVLGPSLFSARLVAVTFGLLSLCAVFEYTYRLYGPRNALLASILLASMPGFIILCRLALIETMLMFFFSLALLLFWGWIHTNSNKLLVLTGIAAGLGVLAKYQSILVGAVMLAGIMLMYRDNIIKKIGKLLFIAIIAGLVFLPWFAIVYQYYATGNIEIWLYAISVGNVERTAYSLRFPAPIFYLIEMTYPYSHIHPISLPIYGLALCGLGLWAWRRKEADKFGLIWFVLLFIIFTIIPNKNWRYLVPLFPVFAVTASTTILSIWDKLRTGLKNHRIGLRNPKVVKALTVVFVVSIGASVVYSLSNAYTWIEQDHVKIPIKEAAQYVHDNSAVDEGTVVLFTGNYFSTDMLRFYIRIFDTGERVIFAYPKNPIDAYPPTLNETLLSEMCVEKNVKYLSLYEHGNITYYDSDWKSYYVLDRLISSGNFTQETVFGTYPRRITVLQFTPNQQN
jgi:4-amino-4-deoxy-L-arabinose transferase-like glycosyltransferase